MAHSVSRFDLFAGLLAAAFMASGSPAMAAKKKKRAAAPAAAASANTPSDAPAAGLPTSTSTTSSSEKSSTEAASQAQDQERPKPILEEASPSPPADDKGNVNFMGSKNGHGRITVKAPPQEKAKVYLEGRYFGLAPRTINKIPPGDYIIEITYPNGKSVTKPVSVSGDEEAVVELGSSSDIAGPAQKPMAPEKIQKRIGLAKGIGIAAIGLAVVGLGAGIWEYTVQKDYDKKANSSTGMLQRETLDDLSRKGDRLALAANICFVGAAVGLIAAGIIYYPAYKARKSGGGRTESPDVAPPMSFMLSPGRTLGSFNAGLVYRF